MGNKVLCNTYSVRQMTFTDLDQVLKWRNHKEVRRYMYTSREINLGEHLAWFERSILNNKLHLLIFECDNVPSGYVSFEEHKFPTVADWGFYLMPDSPTGMGRLLGIAALNFAFNRLGFYKVCGQVISYNERSIKYHLNLGFQQEGILREQYFDGVNYHNVINFGLLASEWSKAAGKKI